MDPVNSEVIDYKRSLMILKLITRDLQINGPSIFGISLMFRKSFILSKPC